MARKEWLYRVRLMVERVETRDGEVTDNYEHVESYDVSLNESRADAMGAFEFAAAKLDIR